MKKRSIFNLKLVEKIRRGGVGVIPTDTLYGIVGSALKPATVVRIYRLRKRNLKKPMIVLIGDVKDLKKFGITLSPKSYVLITKLWPGKVSVVLPCGGSHSERGRRAIKKFAYLHRGTKSIAFRMPKPAALRNFLKKTGPLVAPTANLEGQPPAKTITKAKHYFGARADFYVDKGKLTGKPSKLISLVSGAPVVLRK